MNTLATCLLIPVIASLSALALYKYKNVRDVITFLLASILFGLFLSLVPDVLNGQTPSLTLFQIIDGVPLAFSLEPLGLIFALIASGLWAVNTLYSVSYLRANNEKNQSRFFAFVGASIFGAVGVATADNLLTFFFFYELLTLSTYPLVNHHGTEYSRKGANTYLAYLLATSISFLLLGILLTWSYIGSLDFRSGGLLTISSEAPVGLLLFLFMFGIGKAALMPFHKWLPSAMVAPTPVSALLHAVAVVKAGVFGILKVIIYVFGIETLQAAPLTSWLTLIAAFTIITASIFALRVDNLKQRLAYSTVSQLSYIVLCGALFLPSSMVAGAFHIAVHAFSKITLFFAVGAIYTATHRLNASDLAGIGKRMPVTMVIFGVGALSIVGLPPMAGFFSKWNIVYAAIEGQSWISLATILVSTLLNTTYFIPVLYIAFFKEEKTEFAKETSGEAPKLMLFAMVVSASVTIALGLNPGIFWALATALGGQ